MSTIAVRRSGLVAFAIRIGSTLTGLVFVIVVTSNLTDTQLGLWTLLLSLVNYMVFLSGIISFWAIRQRARGLPDVGRTALFLAIIFSVILALGYLAISVPVAASVKTGLFYFLITTPQVPLLVIAGILEALLVATSPVRWSLGFGLFEVSKVGFVLVLVPLLHLSLEGAILSIIGAQFVQFTTVAIFTRSEFKGKVSRALIGRTLRGSWIALLSNIPSFITGLDDLVIASIIGSTQPLGYFTAATTFASVTLYSSYIATGLYPSILAGREPGRSTSQILEIQLMLVAPIAIGTLILREKLLNILQASVHTYVLADNVLVILLLSLVLFSFTPTLEGVIMGSDRTDVRENVAQKEFLGSRMFLLSKINIGVGLAYIAGIAAMAFYFHYLVAAPDLVEVALVWAIVNLASSVAMFLLKLYCVLRITRIQISREVSLGVVVASAAFAVVLYFVNPLIPLEKTAPMQTAYIVVGGLVALAVYTAVLMSLSKTARAIVTAAVSNVLQLGSAKATSA